MSKTTIATQMQMNNISGMDAYLTKDPEFSLFTYMYKRSAPYAKHTTMLNFNEKVDFGRLITTTILPDGGDLAGCMYLYFQLPPLVLPEGSNYVGYTQAIAYAMIDYVEVRIGETVIDRQTGFFMEVMDYLTTPANKTQSRYKSVGRYDTVNVLTINALSPQSVYVPLHFWFNKKPSMALPLATLAGQPVKIAVKLKPFVDLVTYDGPVTPVAVPIAQSGLIVDYYMLGEDEKLDFKDEPQEYLIEQWQENVFEIAPGMTTNRFELNFEKSIKEIVFCLREKVSEDNNDYFNFGRRDPNYQGGEFLENISFSLDGRERLESLPESYYRLITPQNHHSFAGNRNIYCIPFSQFPEMNQPSGTVNFTRFDSKELVLDLLIRSQMYLACSRYLLQQAHNLSGWRFPSRIY